MIKTLPFLAISLALLPLFHLRADEKKVSNHSTVIALSAQEMARWQQQAADDKTEFVNSLAVRLSPAEMKRLDVLTKAYVKANADSMAAVNQQSDLSIQLRTAERNHASAAVIAGLGERANRLGQSEIASTKEFPLLPPDSYVLILHRFTSAQSAQGKIESWNSDFSRDAKLTLEMKRGF